MPPAQGELFTPPFFGRIFIGRQPYADNDLVCSLANGGSHFVEVWIDGQAATVVLNNQRVMRPVVRGDHAGRTVPLYPPNNSSYGHLQLDSHEEHGFEVWCYTEIPGVGLVQTGHRTFSHDGRYTIGVDC